MFLPYKEKVQTTLNKLEYEKWDAAISLICKKYEAKKKIFTCGNGGSASTASHYIVDWNKMSQVHNGVALNGICLNDNIGLITAYANDIGYEVVFAEQLKFSGDSDDLLIVVSGSGNSPNILAALNTARYLDMETIAVVGFDGGVASQIADITVHVPIDDMQISEDLHLMFGHMVMKKLCNLRT